MEKSSIKLFINDKEVEASVPEDLSLLKFLREHMGLTGAKDGCSAGHCGACTVLVDGEPKLSCMTPLKDVQGRRVETIEGLAREGSLHPLQKAFVEAGAVQCGYCTPGMILSAKALLDRNLSPTDADIKRALARNICRCTGYVKIVEAIHRAADEMAGRVVPSPPINTSIGSGAVGKSMLKNDAFLKVKGELKYAADMVLPSMIEGKILWSEHPCARILKIETEEAKKMPGVSLVLTHEDLPAQKVFGWPAPGYPVDQPLLATDRVYSMGDLVAVVFAESLEQAEEAVKKIRVEYQPTSGVFNALEALKPDAPKVHPGHDNLVRRFCIRKGDLDKAFAEAAAVAEGRFTTPFVDHAVMEMEAAVAAPSEDGGVTVWDPTQANRIDREHVAHALGLAEEKVRVIQMPLGGAFGGRLEQLHIPVLPALAAHLTGRPAKIVLNRSEVLRIHPKRHAFIMDYKVSVDRAGNLTGVYSRLVADTGAYALTAVLLIEQALVNCCGPYVPQNLYGEGLLVYTNNLAAGAFRGYGANQPTFAFETLLEELAHKLKMDPYELRMKNLLDSGSATATGQILRGDVGIKPSLSAAWENLKSSPLPTPGKNKKIGVGMGCGFRGTGAGLGAEWPTGANLEIRPGGRLLLKVGCADIGQGSETIFRQIAADATGVAFDRIDIIAGDTALTPEGSRIAASRQTIQTGNAVLMAAREFQTMLKRRVAQSHGLDPERLEIRGDHLAIKGNGKILTTLDDVSEAVEKDPSLELKVEYMYRHPDTYPLSEDVDAIIAAGGRMHYMAYAYTACVAVVEVDETTGAVKVLKLISANEVGPPLNPLNLEGQIEGSAVMGMGYALSEEFVIEEGVPKTTTLAKCRVPRIGQSPEVVPIAIHLVDPFGPYGAKGVGEIAILAIPPAITNAIYNAVGVRIRDLPATREKIAAALKKGRG